MGRETQPHRKGPREQTQALGAMKKGAPDQLPNPMDAVRHLQQGQQVKRQIARSRVLEELSRPKRY